jgi:hypothetical protein
MADETKVEPQYLSDFLGTPAEQRAQKSKYISEHGFEKFEQIVLRSQPNVNRKK